MTDDPCGALVFPLPHDAAQHCWCWLRAEGECCTCGASRRVPEDVALPPKAEMPLLIPEPVEGEQCCELCPNPIRAGECAVAGPRLGSLPVAWAHTACARFAGLNVQEVGGH